jgi:hypothetical protein
LYSAPIVPPAAASPRLVRVLVPERVSRVAQPGWSDLRVIDDSGTEVPYVLHARTARRSHQRRPARLIDFTYTPGEDTRATLDLGAGALIHNRIEIETAVAEFFVRVAIDASANGRDWRIVREDAPIYRFTASGLEGNQTVSYADNASRYLRLRITDGGERFPLTTVQVRHEIQEEAELVPAAVAVRPDAAAPPGETWWVAEGGGQPLSVVEIAAEQETFHRPVRIRASDDGRTWHEAGSGAVYRMARDRRGEDATRGNRRVELSETRTRFLRVEVVNRNDAPLAGARVGVYTTPRRVVFRVEPGRGYRLLYGNPRAPVAEYEIARVTTAAELGAATSADLGPEAANPAHVDPAPWSERHPVVLWTALIAALAVLGALAVRALKSAGAG